MARARVLLAIAIVALGGCSQQQQAFRQESNVNESVSVTGPTEAIRGLEADVRAAIESHKETGASVSFNESGGPPPRVVDADPNILRAAFDDAKRKAGVLANAVHATLGDPIAVDEVNAADPTPRYGGDVALKGASNLASRVNVPAGGPEIVRVTFALSSRGRGPSSVTVYGLQGTRTAQDAAPPPTHLSINILAGGPNALQTVNAWEKIVRDAGHKRGISDADIRVGNVNANIVGRQR